MATIRFPLNQQSSVGTFINAVDVALFESTIVSASTSSLVLRFGSVTYTISGTSFSYSTVEGANVLSGGTIGSVVVSSNGVQQLTVTDLNLSAAQVAAAIQSELTGTDIAAVETLFTGLSYDYRGNGNADILLANARSGDGVLLNLRGNDLVRLNGGDDNFFLGNGNDRAFGGTGNDRLSGGNGRDTLTGDANDDVLYGGGHADILIGGTGNDQLFGGTGNDTFVFRNGFGRDQARDFSAAEGDKVQLDDALWSGTLTRNQVVARFGGELANGTVFLDFGDGDRITFAGITDFAQVTPNILIV